MLSLDKIIHSHEVVQSHNVFKLSAIRSCFGWEKVPSRLFKTEGDLLFKTHFLIKNTFKYMLNHWFLNAEKLPKGGWCGKWHIFSSNSSNNKALYMYNIINRIPEVKHTWSFLNSTVPLLSTCTVKTFKINHLFIEGLDWQLSLSMPMSYYDPLSQPNQRHCPRLKPLLNFTMVSGLNVKELSRYFECSNCFG